jgi:hypothetical protein
LQDTKELRKIKGLHMDLFANLPTHLLSLDKGGRTNRKLLARTSQSPAVWGSRGSTELLNKEKKTEEVWGGAHRRQGCREVAEFRGGRDGGRQTADLWLEQNRHRKR